MILQILSLDCRLKPWLAFLNLVSFELSPPPFRAINLAKLRARRRMEDARNLKF